MASLDFQVHLAPWAMQALRVRKGRKEVQVIRDWRDHQASEVVRARPAREVRQDPQALERKVTEVLLENLVFVVLLDLLVRLDQKAHRELLGHLGHQVNQVSKVSEARLAHLELKATEGFLVLQDLKVTMVKQDSEVCQVALVYQERPETEDPKDQQGLLELMVKKAQEANKDLLESEVLLDLLEMVFQEHLDFRDHQEYQGIQDGLGPRVMQVHQEESLMQVAPVLWQSLDLQDLLVLPALLGLLDYQAPLALLVCLANKVLKVIGETRETREKQESQ